MYFSYIHSYLNYANIAWASTYQTKLKTVHYHQKHAVRIVFNQEKLTHSRPLLRSLNALNVYQINLYQHLNFMHKVSNNVAPLIFNDMFKKPSHKYPTNFSHNNFNLKKCSLNCTKYSISFRGPKLWNEFLTPANLKFCRNYYIKSIWIFKYALEQSFGALLWEGVFGNLCGGFVGQPRRWRATSIKLHGGFAGVVLRRWFSPVGRYIYIYIYTYFPQHI